MNSIIRMSYNVKQFVKENNISFKRDEAGLTRTEANAAHGE